MICSSDGFTNLVFTNPFFSSDWLGFFWSPRIRFLFENQIVLSKIWFHPIVNTAEIRLLPRNGKLHTGGYFIGFSVLGINTGILSSKGQLISKCLFAVLNSPKKRTKTSRLEVPSIVVKLNCFVRFLGELKIPKRHFVINWPANKSV